MPILSGLLFSSRKKWHVWKRRGRPRKGNGRILILSESSSQYAGSCGFHRRFYPQKPNLGNAIKWFSNAVNITMNGIVWPTINEHKIATNGRAMAAKLPLNYYCQLLLVIIHESWPLKVVGSRMFAQPQFFSRENINSCMFRIEKQNRHASLRYTDITRHIGT